jgi:hypothetical protein
VVAVSLVTGLTCTLVPAATALDALTAREQTPIRVGRDLGKRTVMSRVRNGIDGTIEASSVGGLPSVSRRSACHGVAQPRHASLGDNYGGRITMALRLQVDGPRNAAEQVVGDGEGTASVLALSNRSSADAKPIGAPKPGPRSRRESAPAGVR